MLKLFYPVKDPINQQNLFGANPAEYKPLGQNGHPGNDFESQTGTKIFSPVDGKAFYVKDSLGGDGIWIRTTDDEGNNYNIILWHMPTVQPVVAAANGETLNAPVSGDSTIATSAQYPFQIPTDGSLMAVNAGQFLGYTDNSGYGRESTGPHLHMGVMPCDKNWNALSPSNGFMGCVDPTQYLIGQYAEDIPEIDAAVQASNQLVQIVAQNQNVIPPNQIIAILLKVAAFLQSLI